jgi:hypothetical protein
MTATGAIPMNTTNELITAAVAWGCFVLWLAIDARARAVFIDALTYFVSRRATGLAGNETQGTTTVQRSDRPNRDQPSRPAGMA